MNKPPNYEDYVEPLGAILAREELKRTYNKPAVRFNKQETEGERTGKALAYCLLTLKTHHMTKRGISALVKKTEEIAFLY